MVLPCFPCSGSFVSHSPFSNSNSTQNWLKATRTHICKITKPKLRCILDAAASDLKNACSHLTTIQQESRCGREKSDWLTEVLTDCGQNSLLLQILQKHIPMSILLESPLRREAPGCEGAWNSSLISFMSKLLLPASHFDC